MEQKSEKFCVFCGKKPEDKTKEHILPKWLLKLTGDPKRIANFRLSEDDPYQFPIDQFHFPACNQCNVEGSKLEAKAARIIEPLLKDNILAATAEDIDGLLDWFDKLRIGIWLAFLMLHKDKVAIKPNFHINNRMGSVDRALLIYRLPKGPEGIRLAGAAAPAFFTNPSSLMFQFNNFYFVTVARYGLMSHSLGFPFYVKNNFPFGDPLKIVKGSKQPKMPCFPDTFLKLPRSATLAQAIISDPDPIYSYDGWESRLMENSETKTHPYLELGYSGFNIEGSNRIGYYVPELLGNPFESEVIIRHNIFDIQNECVEQDYLFFPDGLRNIRSTMKECRDFSRSTQKYIIKDYKERIKKGEAGKEHIVEKFIRESFKKYYRTDGF